MKLTLRAQLMSCALISTGLFPVTVAAAQEAGEDAEAVQETIVVTGARGKPRSVSDSPVPIDVLSEEDIAAVPFTDANDILRTLVPSYSLSRQPISDGASFIRPAQLRGLPTDKTLVLVNSKRRHRAALVSIGGSGTQGPDIATIPAAALKSVEVLRDGAAAQYGSDAIAGVINFILKDSPEGGTVTVDFGEYYEGDGTQYTLSGNIGLPLGESGFISISGEITDGDATSRSEQYCESFACVDVNDPTFLTGLDTTLAGFDLETYIPGLEFANVGQGDVVQPWGQPNIEAMRLFVNAGYTVNQYIDLYAFGNYSDSKSDGSFFHRFPGNGTIENYRLEDGSLWSPLFIFPGGFTPRFLGEVLDSSLVGGLRGELDNGFAYDFSGRFGENEIEYTLFNTINPSLGPETPTSFQPGDLINTELQFQADFSQEFEVGLAEPLVFAFGASYLDEEYELVEGDEASYIAGPYALPDPFGLCDGMMPSAAGAEVIMNGSSLDCADPDDPVFRANGVGSNGFPGYSPAFSETYARDSYALYGDLSADVTDRWFLQGALRFEDYSDFGEEVVWKLASKFDITDNIAIRGSVGTGFRAPTPGQQGTTNVSTRLPNGVPVATGLFPAGGPVAQALGATPLEPEKSTNYTLGATANFGDFTLTVDFYQIDLEDRVNAISTQDVSSTPPAITDPNDPDFDQGDVDAFNNFVALQSAGVQGAESIGGVFYFTNAFDTTTQGVDIVATYGMEWAGGASTNFTGSINYNTTEFDSEVNALFNAESQFDFENALPDWRGVFTVVHETGPFTFTGRANYYGEYENSNGGSTITQIQEFDPVVQFDIEGAYEVSDVLTLALGVRNVTDEYPDEGTIGETCCGRIYRSDSIVDWQGGFYYAKAVAKF
ncbi:MAG: TonB-dependent receptor [Pseudomonadota bacterium]